MTKYYKRKAAGLCVNCGKRDARPNKTSCQICADRKREKGTKKYRELKDLGVCPQCKGDVDDKNYTYCSKCRLVISEYMQDLREKRIQDGLCIDCEKPVQDTIRCTHCYSKMKDYIDLKIADGLCSVCFKPRESHSRFCDHHLQLHQEYLERYKERS